MITLASVGALLRGLLQGLPRPPLPGLAGAIVLLLAWAWHDHRVHAAYIKGTQAQVAADQATFTAAASAATLAQRQRNAALAARQSQISKGTDHALATSNADLARRYADLRLRWAAARSDQSGAGSRGATAIPDPAEIADDTTCAARGWVSFNTAATAAEAADTAIAKDDAWIAWAAAQAAAWPGAK